MSDCCVPAIVPVNILQQKIIVVSGNIVARHYLSNLGHSEFKSDRFTFLKTNDIKSIKNRKINLEIPLTSKIIELLCDRNIQVVQSFKGFLFFLIIILKMVGYR